jgi:hypothetical protein
MIAIAEHDPMLYEESQDMAEYVSVIMREALNDVAVLFYAPRADPFSEELAKNADKVFCFNEGPRTEARVATKDISRTEKSQTTLEAFT